VSEHCHRSAESAHATNGATPSRQICAAALCALLCVAGGSALGAATVGQPVPACELHPLQGSQRVALDEFRGSVLYVDFWASWCRPCAKSFPFLNAIDEEFRDRGLRVLGVNLDEQVPQAEQFLAKFPARFALAADPSGRCPRAFGVAAMPSSYLIDRKGIVRHVHRGFRSDDAAELREMVQGLLSEQLDAR